MKYHAPDHVEKMRHSTSTTAGQSAIDRFDTQTKGKNQASKFMNARAPMDDEFDMLDELENEDDEWNTVDDEDYDWAKAEDSTEKQQQMEVWWKEKEEKQKLKKWFW